MKVETKWCPIAEIMTLEVVRQHAVDIIPAQMWWTAVDHAACIFTCLQLIHDQLPDAGITARWTVLIGAHTTMGHLEVQCIWPERWIRVWCDHRGIIDKAKFLHHKELTIPAHTQERNAHSANLLHAHAGKFVDYIGLANHFIKPILNGGILGPPKLWATMPANRKRVTKEDCESKENHLRHRVHSNFMSIVPEFLHILIVGIRMGYIECTANGATVGIAPIGREQHLGEELPIVVIDGIIECQ